MKKAVQKVQLLKNMTKIFAEGNYQVTVKNILNALQNQGEQEMQYLEKQMLKIFPICHKILKYLRSMDKFYMFIKQFQVEQHKEKEVIFQMGEVGRKMYFILDGNLNNKQPVAILVPGEYFGEVSLHHRLPRTATITCATNCVLLVISYEAYYNFLQPVIEHQIAVQYYQLRPTALFHGWSELALALIVHHLKIITYQRNQYIYKQDQQDKAFYVVKSGEILIEKKIKIKGKLQNHGIVSLGIGQCFGDYEYIENQTWVQNRIQLDQIKRITNAQSTTVSEIYKVPIYQYLEIADNYHSMLLKRYLRQNKIIIKDRIEQLNQQIKNLENSDEFQNQEIAYIAEIKPPQYSPYQNLLNTIRNRKIIPQQQHQVQKDDVEQQEYQIDIKKLKKKIQSYFYQPNTQKRNQEFTNNSLSTKLNNRKIQKIKDDQLDKQSYLQKIQAMRDKLLAQTSGYINSQIETNRQQLESQESSPAYVIKNYQSMKIQSYKNSRIVTPSRSQAIKTPNPNQSERKYDFHNVYLVKSQSQSSFQFHKQENYPVKKAVMEVRKQKKSSFGCLITQI